MGCRERAPRAPRRQKAARRAPTRPAKVSQRRPKKSARSSSASRYEDTALRAARAASCVFSSLSSERDFGLLVPPPSSGGGSDPLLLGSATISTIPSRRVPRLSMKSLGGIARRRTTEVDPCLVRRLKLVCPPLARGAHLRKGRRFPATRLAATGQEKSRARELRARPVQLLAIVAGESGGRCPRAGP